MSFLNLNFEFLVWCTVIVACMWLAAAYGGRRRLKLLKSFFGSVLVIDADATVSKGKRGFRRVLIYAGILLVLVSLARPWWGKRLVPYPRRSRDVLVVFDCSRSMLADDIAPSRLEHGKWLVRRLAEVFTGDRFGLVAFAGDAFLECPLTQDYSSLNLFLDELDTRTIPLGGTNIQRALEVASDAFRGAEGGDRAVILITDGDELEGDAAKSAEQFADTGIPLLVVGLGDPVHGSMVRDADGKYLRDADGELVSSKLSETRLKELAALADGLYVRSTTTNPNIEPLAGRIESLIPEEGEEQVKQREIERYQIPMAAAMACFLTFLFTGERRRRPVPASETVDWTVAGVLLICSGVLLSCAGAAVAADLAEDKEITVLERELETAEAEEKGRLLHNLGVLYQQQGGLEQASEHYREALVRAAPGSREEALSRWNLGVCRHEIARSQALENPDKSLDKLQQAEADYRAAIARVTEADEFGRNLELLARDREFVEKVREQIRKLSELQENARDQASEAAESQRQAGGESDPVERTRKQNEANRQAGEAKSAVDELRDELDKLRDGDGQQDLPVDEAGRAIDQAIDLQAEASAAMLAEDERLAKMQEAAEALKKAADLLGAGQESASNERNSDGSENESENAEREEDSSTAQEQNAGDQMTGTESSDQDKPLGEDPVSPEQPAGDGQAAAKGETENGKIDRGQAAAILMDMQRRERDLREELKRMRADNVRVAPVERDW